ncbi:bifunctional 3'-5' exonuclease/DNA polymerase [Thermocrinis sp.]
MKVDFEYLTSTQSLGKLYEKVKDIPFVYIDTETVGDKTIRLVQIASEEDIFLLDLYELGEVGINFLKDLLSKKGIVGHNLKFDIKYMHSYGIEPYAVFDTMIASQLIGDSDRHSLQKLAIHYLGEVLDKSLQLSNWGSIRLSKEQLEYAALDVKIVRGLFPILLKKLNELTPITEENLLKTRTAKVFGLKNPVAIVEMAFVQEVAKLELKGLPVDVEELERILKDLSKDLQKKAMDFLIKYRVDPMSSKRLGELLVKKYGLDLPKTEKGNISTDDRFLAEYIDHPVVKDILDIRNIKKSLDKLEEIKAGLRGRRVYPEFKQIGAVTGRMSSINPNVQNIPRHLRRIFKAEEGNVFVIADFSQIELRIAAEYVGDENMIKVFNEGRDMHKYTASVLLGKREEEVSKEERQLAKAVNFGLIYGISARGLAEYAYSSYGIDLSIEEAEDIRKRFFEHFKAFKEWHNAVKKELKERGESRGYTLLGRRYVAHTFPDAVNYPIQGTGADLLKLSVLVFDAEVRRENVRASVVNLVHDEIVVECKEEEGMKVAELLERAMKRAGGIILKKVPVEVEVAVKERWEKE